MISDVNYVISTLPMIRFLSERERQAGTAGRDDNISGSSEGKGNRFLGDRVQEDNSFN